MEAILAHQMGAALGLGTPATGVVHSTFDQAVNLMVGPTIWTLVHDAARLSPFGLYVFTLRSVMQGDAVFVRAGFLSIGALVIDARSAAIWTPAPWVAGQGFDAAREWAAQRAKGMAWPGTAALVHDVGTALDRGAGLEEVVRRTIGQGPGLTPSGDDALVGILAALTLSPFVQGGRVRRLAAAIAPHLEETTDISRHLLLQAMQGHFGRPLHDLGRALHAPGRDLEAIVDRALSVGATSGADACLGLTATLARVNSPQQVAG
jgi:hypothetical protein